MKKNVKILITGYKGYIGKALIALLIDSIKDGVLDLGKHIKLEGIDLVDNDDIVTSPLPEADYVIHLAAQAGALSSMRNPMWDAHCNVLGSIRIAQHYGNTKTKIVFTTSGAAIAPQSPYGVSKRAAEEYFRIFASKNTVICRLSSIYGNKPKGVVDTFIREEVPVIYGDGTAERDFVHVIDIALGLIKACEWPAGTYEMGSGKGTTIREIAEATGKEFVFKPARAGEIHRAILQNTTPNWKPKNDVIEYIKGKC